MSKSISISIWLMILPPLCLIAASVLVERSQGSWVGVIAHLLILLSFWRIYVLAKDTQVASVALFIILFQTVLVLTSFIKTVS